MDEWLPGFAPLKPVHISSTATDPFMEGGNPPGSALFPSAVFVDGEEGTNPISIQMGMRRGI
jgi:hypothetical protein